MIKLRTRLYSMVRVFVAAGIPGEFVSRLAEVQNTLGFSKARLNFVDPGIAHITLKFIGEVPAGSIGAIKNALGNLEFEPFMISFRGVFFNNPSSPRVIWTAGEDGGRSSVLRNCIEDILAPLGIEREKRRFTPHVTIARVKKFHPSLAASVASLGDPDFGTFEVSSVSLKSSILKPSGPVYDDILEVAF